MSLGGFDPSILQDFLTESGELLEQLEANLVVLESNPTDPDKLNEVFRALHTIKGSASFLGLSYLIRIAHAAESALNAARNGLVFVDRPMMNLLLQATDLIKTHMNQVREGQDLLEPDADLVAELNEIGEGKRREPGKPKAAGAGAQPHAATVAGAVNIEEGATTGELSLPSNKADLVEFLANDMDDSLAKVVGALAAMSDEARRAQAAAQLGELCDALARSVEFFEVAPMTTLAAALSEAAEPLAGLAPARLGQALPRMLGIAELLSRQAKALRTKRVLSWNVENLLARLSAAIGGDEVEENAKLAAGCDAVTALRADGVLPRPGASAQPAASEPDAEAEPAAKGEGKKAAGAGTSVEQTIRVEVGRLETLMNLVGELVLQKNRIVAIARTQGDQASREAAVQAAGGLDRITSDIQTAVMRTRMQPLEKLFGKYPRLIRDLCIKTGKKIDLKIEGGDTEVDKSVIEELADPLIHLLRNSADHGVEPPADRVRAGKSETGTIRLTASHEGSHVRVQVIDDGRGLVREKIINKAVERGLTTREQAAGLSDREVFNFIMLPGFSTAEQVSDLSGRGVGMDVVRNNIEKLKGTIELASQAPNGTTISISIPLTVAIMPAMMVGVGSEIYAIPLTNILEIVRPEPSQISTIGEKPVLRLRDSVLPLLSAAELFEHGQSSTLALPFVVVLAVGEKRVGLMVSRPIGQQEIVIKPLDEHAEKADRRGPVSGATVRDDGGVSLIVDVARLVSLAQPPRNERGAPGNPTLRRAA